MTDKKLGKTLHPDVLRRLGGMTMLCSYYGAAVIFANDDKGAELMSKEDPAS